MEKNDRRGLVKPSSLKLALAMKLTVFLLIVSIFSVQANVYSPKDKVILDLEGVKMKKALETIESLADCKFLYNDKKIDTDRLVSVKVIDRPVSEVLDMMFQGTAIYYILQKRQIVLKVGDVRKSSPTDNGNRSSDIDEEEVQQSVSGTVTDANGMPLPGANIVEKGTTNGTQSDFDGNYSIKVTDDNSVLIVSYIGYTTKEVVLNGENTINITLQENAAALDEVVLVGYGTMRKSDLTGAVTSANIDASENIPNVSIAQSLHGSVAGLNVGQITQSGQEPNISVRGRTSLSGAQNPLIVLDGVIYRGNIIDINPDDIEGVDILKDNSAAAVYGSQAANGVIIITTKRGKTGQKKPIINFSSNTTFKTPAFELTAQGPEEFVQKNIVGDLYNGRTLESNYLENNPNYQVPTFFKSSAQTENYNAGKTTNWYDLVTNDNIYMHNQNLSLTSNSENTNLFISLGLTDDHGYMINEKYKRYNARINIDTQITDWLKIGVQSFVSISDYSGQDVNLRERYNMPYELAYDENGELAPFIEGGLTVNPLVIAEADNKDIRNNFFGNLYADISLPFIAKGLSYKVNLYNNYRTNRNYYFQPFANNFQGEGGKYYSNTYNISSDNILTYKFINNLHNLDITLVSGFEKIKNDYTDSNVSMFGDPTLGYNRLQAGNAEQRIINSGAWEESSMYNMGRLFYSYRNKYMFTGTIRRDGFSGFSEGNKFGIFPSLALGWVPSEESFFPDNDILNYLKLRASYGSSGNRTIGRYQTLAKVGGGYNYIDDSGSPVLTKAIESLESPNLKWETTTGINIGLDFGLLESKINGSIEYYNNNTENLLYNVDIPSISRYSEFPDNLGKLHNTGLEVTLSTLNYESQNFIWNSSFAFSRNRDELKELLGFDNDGDGKEDDLISEGLFINEPLNTIYHYEIDGGKLYQLGDDIPSYADVGTFVVVDQNNDGNLDADNDYKILGYNDPSYRFSISNEFKYKNWSLYLFINSVQGGKDYYYARDDFFGFNGTAENEQPLQRSFPKYELADYWRPENPTARYQRIRPDIVNGNIAYRYAQRNFIRLQDISLSYNFSSDFLSKTGIDNLKIYLSGKNLFTLTKWRGWDPETGEPTNPSGRPETDGDDTPSGGPETSQTITQGGRPVLRSYTLGFNIEF